MTFRFRAFSWNAIAALGPDTSEWLGGIVTCEVPTDPGNGARWGLLLSKQGKIQAELVLCSRGSAEVEVAVRGGDAAAVRTVLDHHLVMEDVELGAVLPVPYAVVLGAGAESLALLAAAGVEVVSAPAPFAFADATLVRGRGNLPELERALAELGQELSDAEWDAARVGMGLPSFGVDYDDSDNPHQASLERRAVSWQKGCYLGQEVVFMQDARGKVKRRLVRLAALQDELIAAQQSVTTEAGEPAGQVTTAFAGRALAKVSAPYFEPGTRLVVGGAPVTVEALDAGLFGRTGPPDRVQK